MRDVDIRNNKKFVFLIYFEFERVYIRGLRNGRAKRSRRLLRHLGERILRSSLSLLRAHVFLHDERSKRAKLDYTFTLYTLRGEKQKFIARSRSEYTRIDVCARSTPISYLRATHDDYPFDTVSLTEIWKRRERMRYCLVSDREIFSRSVLEIESNN